MLKPSAISKGGQRKSNGCRYSQAHYHKRREQPNCLQYYRIGRSKGDIGQTQKHL